MRNADFKELLFGGGRKAEDGAVRGLVEYEPGEGQGALAAQRASMTTSSEHIIIYRFRYAAESLATRLYCYIYVWSRPPAGYPPPMVWSR